MRLSRSPRDSAFKLFGWQRWALLHGLELDPDDDRLYRFRTVVVEVSRQSGKTLTMLILALWHLYARDSRQVGRQVVCVDVSWNRARTYIARCGHDEAGVPVVGIAEDRPGTDWVLDWLIAHRGSFESIVVQSNGAPVTSLYGDIEYAHTADGRAAQLPLISWKGTDLSAATGMMFDRLESRKIRHLAHPGLDAAATSAAVKVLGHGGWVIDRAKSVTDAAPLQAVIGAVWGVETLAPRRSHDLLQSVWAWL
jgi:hypothetical protein